MGIYNIDELAGWFIYDVLALLSPDSVAYYT